jgi:hypothetical protein
VAIGVSVAALAAFEAWYLYLYEGSRKLEA